MAAKTRPHVALVGEGDRAARWAAALEPGADVCALDDGALYALDGVVIAPGAREPFVRAREALLAGVPVLYAAPFVLSPAQAAALQELSQSQGRLLRVAEPFQHQPGFAFLRRLVHGREPFWRPLYLRTTSLGPLDGRRLDEVAIEDLAMCQALLDGMAGSVNAVAQHDETGAPCAAFVTVRYREGIVVQCTVSPAEATAVRQLVAVTASRTVIFDQLDPAGSLRILPSGQAEESAREACCAGAARRDPVTEETARFLHALATGDLSSANAGRWVRVAAIWRAACASMSAGGPVEPSVPAARLGRETPPLRLIEGGVGSGRTARARPALTLVAG